MREVYYNDGKVQGVVVGDTFITKHKALERTLPLRLQGMHVHNIKYCDRQYTLPEAISHGFIRNGNWYIHGIRQHTTSKDA